MKTFKSFVVESLDKPYKFHHEGEDEGAHQYTYEDHNGDSYTATLQPMDERGSKTNVEFSKDGSGFEATGTAGHHAAKHFATIKAIMQHHLKNNPRTRLYSFSSAKTRTDDNEYKENSRNKLYAKMTARAGGSSVSTDNDKDVYHVIPANAIR